MIKIAPWTGDNTGALYHWCPACEKLHVIPPNRWTRSGPDDAPSFSPSFLQYDVKGIGNHCHYIITRGNISFCPDSWHKRNDTVPMPDIPLSALERLNGMVGVTTDAVFERKP